MKKWIAILAIIAAVSATILLSSFDRTESQMAGMDTLDSTTLILDHKKLNAGDYMILYSVGPKIITSGIVVAKLPCDLNSEPDNWMFLGGVGTDLVTFRPIEVELAQGTPGEMCAYAGDLNTDDGEMSVIVIVNTGSEGLRFPRTSSVTVTVHSVMSQ